LEAAQSLVDESSKVIYQWSLIPDKRLTVESEVAPFFKVLNNIYFGKKVPYFSVKHADWKLVG
jgi:hypothetical protein